jgi:hypothetical protein
MTLTITKGEDKIHGLAAELRRQLETKRDLVADTRRTSFAPVVRSRDTSGARYHPFVVDLPDGAEAFAVTEHAHDQIGSHLDVPAKFYDRLRHSHPELFENLMNGLLSREPSKQLIRTMDGKVRAFLSDRYRPRDNWDLLDQAILPALAAHGRDVEVKACELTETRMYLKVVLPDFERPLTPKVGDVIRGGLIVRNSEVGSSSLLIAPYTDELICTNGMIHERLGQKQRHVGRRLGGDDDAAREFYSDETVRLDDAAFFSKCRDVVAGVLTETVFDAIVRDLGELRGLPVEAGPVEAVEVLANRHDLSGDEQQSMLTFYAVGGDFTRLGLLRSMTSMARDLDSPDRRADLERLAGQMVERPELVAA